MAERRSARSEIRPVLTNIAATWAIVFIALVMYAFAWYIFAYMSQEVIAGFQGAYTFPSGAVTVITILQLAIAWHPLFAIFGWILYGYLASTRKEYRGYEM